LRFVSCEPPRPESARARVAAPVARSLLCARLMECSVVPCIVVSRSGQTVGRRELAERSIETILSFADSDGCVRVESL